MALDANSIVGLLLVLIGLFYAFAGVVALKAALTGRLIDIAIAAISLKPPSRTDTLQSLWFLVSALVVLAGGVFLLARLDWAVWAFMASAVGQAVYLLVLAPQVFDVEDAPDAAGRKRTINAFILYVAVTLLLVWAYRKGWFASVRDVSFLRVGLPLAVVGAVSAYGLNGFFRPFAKPGFTAMSDDNDDNDDDLAGTGDGTDGEYFDVPDAASARTILVMAETGCFPLWSRDEQVAGNIDPADLGLSEQLADDLAAWSARFETSIDRDDPLRDVWMEDRVAAHEEEGRALAVRLKAELPGRRVLWHRQQGGEMELPD